MQFYPNEKLIKEGSSAFNKKYYLLKVSADYEIAGSGLRYVDDCYRVAYMFDGNRHSKAYKTLEEAELFFNQWTQPIIEQTA